jgi:carboxymethylenebutenolidase
VVITTDQVEVDVGGSAMRLLVFAPKGEGAHPGVLVYSDIFQLTGPTVRVCARLAGYGFVVAAPEIYHRLEPPGATIPFDDEGRTRGLEDAARTSVAEFDADCRAALDYLAAHPRVATGRLGAAGFCIGGHLAFRAALQEDVRATACFYPTGVHDGKLGKELDAGTLERAREIRGELLLVFGTADPHVPAEARERIVTALRDAGVSFYLKLYAAEHAFMRDEGPRYDPVATDDAFGEMIKFFRGALA